MRLELPKKRHEKLLLIVKKRQELNEERQQIAQIRHNIDQQRCDLEAREAKLLNKPPQEFRRLYVDKRNGLTLILLLKTYHAMTNILTLS
jgi:hypothetical protein